jgi:hypothetical protein
VLRLLAIALVLAAPPRAAYVQLPGSTPVGLVQAAGLVWTADFAQGRVVGVDTGTRRVVRTAAVAGSPTGSRTASARCGSATTTTAR